MTDIRLVMEDIKRHKTRILRTELALSSKTSSVTSAALVVLYSLGLSSIDSEIGYSYYFIAALILGQIVRYFHSRHTVVDDLTWLNQFTKIMSYISVFWFLLFAGNLIQNVGRSQVIVLCYTMVAGLIAAGAYSISISKRDFFIFQISMLSTVVLGYNLSSDEVIYRATGTFMSILFFVFLVVQRKNHENAWYEKILHNFELQNIIDTIPGGISVLRNGVYIHTNVYLQNTILQHGRSKEMIGTKLGELTSTENPFVKNIANFIESKEKQIKFEIPLFINNENRHHLVVAHNILRPQSIDTVVSTIDIQDLKNREIENNINLAKLENSSKMASLGQMSSGLAHEINNPLAIISGRIQILKKLMLNQQIDPESFNKSIDIIEKTTLRIAKIVKGLKTFAREGDNDDFVRGPMTELVDDTLSFCEARFKNNGVTFKYDIDAIKDFMIECRLTQLSQVLLNALNNSFDAVSGLDEKWIDLSIEKKDSKYIFRVTDSGKGIPLAVRDKLMQPFFTTKEVGRGTGLGLSLSKSMVESHNGRIYFNFDHPTNTQLVIEVPEYQKNKNAA